MSSTTQRLLLAALAATTLASLSESASASPIASSSSSDSALQGRDFALKRRPKVKRTGNDLIEWANAHRAHLRGKYGLDKETTSTDSAAKSKRSAGAASLTNYEYDSSFYTSVDIGTPAQAFNMVLDTGSADIWISSSNYTASSSSSFSNSTSAFSIEYGSGDVAGYLATETFELAAHQVKGQTFAVATDVSSGLIDGTTAGIVGLGFQALSTSQAEPIWQSAGESEFSFYLERVSSKTASSSSGSGGGGQPGGTIPGGVGKRQTYTYSSSSDSATATAPGGIFTLGGRNTSLFQGDINWSNVINKSYWLITLGGLSVGNTSLGLGNLNRAAVDTGTTLIGGPDELVSEFYQQIPEASGISGSDGYYQYPCDTTVNATMTFGNQKYTLNSQDFLVSEVDSSGEYCMGSFFSVGSTSQSTLQWIVGDAFLMQVYSIFSNGDTARVGFASLADGLTNASTSSTTVSQTQEASGALSTAAVASLSTVVTVTILSIIAAATLL